MLQPNELRDEVKNARKDLYDDLVQRWKSDIPVALKRFYCIATILDPRQKSLRFPGISSSERETAFVWFLAEYQTFWDNDESKAAEVEETPEPAGIDEAITHAHHSYPQHAGSSFLDFMASLAHLDSRGAEAGGEGDDEDESEEPTQSEADKYLEMPDLPMHTDILKWWASQEKEDGFPQLAVMARQYLGVPATSASAERLFSIAGRVFDDMRQGMGDDILELLMWARINCEKRKSIHE